MNYNLDIPGWMGVRDLQILKQIASHVPENGNILEVGCFLGRSTYALHDGKPASARIEVVDTFIISKLYSLDVGKSDIQGSRQLIDEAINIASKNGSWLESFKHCVTPEVAEFMLDRVLPIKYQIDHAMSKWNREGLIDIFYMKNIVDMAIYDTDIQTPLLLE